MLSYAEVVRELALLLVQFAGVLLPLSLALYVYLHSSKPEKSEWAGSVKNICKGSIRTFILCVLIYCFASLTEVTKIDFIIGLVILGFIALKYLIYPLFVLLTKLELID
jgi:uncharacterized membrane protein